MRIKCGFKAAFLVEKIYLYSYYYAGGVPEWFNGAVSKTAGLNRSSWVRIPPPPPIYNFSIFEATSSQNSNFEKWRYLLDKIRTFFDENPDFEF